MNIRETMQVSPVIPVMVIEDLTKAVPLAQALVKGGVRVLEITLRTSKALDAIKAISDNVPDAIVGVGTAVRPEHFRQAKEAGAVFAVTPGATKELLQAAQDAALPCLPGVMTPADIINAINMGYDAVKFFPAEPAGGVTMLKALLGPFHDLAICPTGGVSLANARDYLSIPNVLCVGGSWVCPAKLVEAGAWDEITKLAENAVAILKA